MDLSDAERRVWAAFPRGEYVDLGGPDPTAEDFSPDDYTDEQRVRGEVLAALLRGAVAAEPGATAAIRLEGAYITGRLDLEDAEAGHPLVANRCCFEELLLLRDASSRLVSLNCSVVPLFNAARATIRGPLLLTDCVLGAVEIPDATIAGRVNLRGSRIVGTNDRASLDADEARVERSLLGPRICRGLISLNGAHIGGDLDLDGCRIIGEFVGAEELAEAEADPTESAAQSAGARSALVAGNVTVGRHLRLGGLEHGGFEAYGEVSLDGATVHGSVVIDGALLENPHGVALAAPGLTVQRSFSAGGYTDPQGRVQFLRCRGQVLLNGASVGGSMNLVGATLAGSDPGSYVLTAANLSVGRNLALFAGYDGDRPVQPFTAVGGVFLDGATVGGSLDVFGAVFDHGEAASRVAFNADNIGVGQDMTMSPAVEATGTVPLRVVGELSLRGATIGGSLSVTGAELRAGPDAAGELLAFAGANLTVKQDLRFVSGVDESGGVLRLRSHGTISLIGAQVSGAIEVAGADLFGRDGAAALNADNLVVEEDLTLVGVDARGTISLYGANIGAGLYCTGVRAAHPSHGPALVADALSAKQGIWLQWQSGVDGRPALDAQGQPMVFAATGSVSLVGAQAPTLTLLGVVLDNPGHIALDLGDAAISQDVWCGPLTDKADAAGRYPPARLVSRIRGTISLIDANVGGNLRLSGVTLSDGEYGRVLDGERLTVQRNLELTAGTQDHSDSEPALTPDGTLAAPFTVDGAVRLASATVRGRLVLPGEPAAARRGRRWYRRWRPGPGTVDLSGATAGQLQLPFWAGPRLATAGLTYGDVGYADPPPDAPARNLGRREALRRLCTDPAGAFQPQPYEQLAAHLRRQGHDGEARRVLRARRVAQVRSARRLERLWARPLGLVYDLLAGYGYLPGRALVWLILAVAGGWWYFREHPLRPVSAGLAEFDPLAYALDAVIPTSPLGPERLFVPTGPDFWVSAALQALGWALSLAVLPAIARLLSRSS